MFISFITKYLLLLSIVTLDSSNVVFFYLITAFKSEGYREFVFCLYRYYCYIYSYLVLYCIISGIYLYYIWYRLSFLSKSILLFIAIHCTIWGNGLNCGILWYIMIFCYLFYIISVLCIYYCIYIILETLFTPHSQLSFIFL